MENEISTSVTLTPVMVYLGAWFSTCGFFWVLFSRGETILSHDVKVRMSNSLKGESNMVGQVDTWPQQFRELFDLIFGPDHLTWNCFWRSSIASIISILIIFLIWMVSGIDSSVIESIDMYFFLIMLLGAAVLLNFLQDYLSLLESRWIIDIMSETKSRLSWFGYILADGFLTGLIFIAFAGFLTGGIPSYDPSTKTVTSTNLLNSLYLEWSFPYIYEVYLILFSSTYFTSLWVWLYALSCFFVRLASLTDRSWNALTYCLNIEDKPILSLGTITIVLITLVYLVAAPFVLS